jgi:hypothetical protein
MTARTHRNRLDAPLLRRDADLLRHCAALDAISVQLEALHQTRTTIAEEERTDADLFALQDKRDTIQKRIRTYRPYTEEGWVAFARAARTGTYACDGEVMCHNEDAQWIAWAIVARVAGLPQLSELH